MDLTAKKEALTRLIPIRPPWRDIELALSREIVGSDGSYPSLKFFRRCQTRTALVLDLSFAIMRTTVNMQFS